MATSVAIEDILRTRCKPREKQTRLVETVCKEEIGMNEFMRFFQEASDVDKGTCADALKHISARNQPGLLDPVPPRPGNRRTLLRRGRPEVDSARA